MKKIIIAALFIISVSAIEAQVLRYPFGSATFATLTVDNDTLTVTPTNSVHYFAASDTAIANTLILADVAKVKAGDVMYVELSGGATVRTFTFSSSYFVSTTVATVANKKKLVMFVFNGTKYVLVNSIQIN